MNNDNNDKNTNNKKYYIIIHYHGIGFIGMYIIVYHCTSAHRHCRPCGQASKIWCKSNDKWMGAMATPQIKLALSL